MRPFFLVILLAIFSPFMLLGAIAALAWICSCTGFIAVANFVFKAEKQIDKDLK